ncbi:hypothetical protein P9112_010588 [Eukaryota sp. TZLM1-RC]
MPEPPEPLSVSVLLSIDTPQYPAWLTRLPRAGELIKDDSDSEPESNEEIAKLILDTRSSMDKSLELMARSSISKTLDANFYTTLSGPPPSGEPLHILSRHTALGPVLSEQKYYSILEERLSQRRIQFHTESFPLEEEPLAHTLVNMSASMVDKKLSLVRKQLPRAAKGRLLKYKELRRQTRNIALAAVKEQKRRELRLVRTGVAQSRAKKLMKEVQSFWRKSSKTSAPKKVRKTDEQKAMEKRMEEEREARRQQRKLNFLLTQTELYSHFLLRKDEQQTTDDVAVDDVTGVSLSYDDDHYNEEDAKRLASKWAEEAANKHLNELSAFGQLPDQQQLIEKQKEKQMEKEMQKQIEQEMEAESQEIQETSEGSEDTSDPSSLLYTNIQQPDMFSGTLKPYQLKGLNWLVSLYDQGINGILADEMGLGKTIQSISFLAHLAETRGIWGPFVVIGQNTILHNWEEEISKFAPKLKVAPYWGGPKERKAIRTMFSQRKNPLGEENSPFHILITSYQYAVQDEKHFKRVPWQFMILDEAQAIKSHSSQRWKSLLSFKCRNRLLLTGTPIQNSMAELWALLHFIMPSLFDSHDEFEEWFSKGIENQAESQQQESQHLKRLHLILKPFMLRREKKDVESEMTPKIEIVLRCDLSNKQKALYESLKNSQSVSQSLNQSFNQSAVKEESETLLNLVMQLRKVCNHPAMFERSETKFPFYFTSPYPTLPSAEPLQGSHSVNFSVPETSTVAIGQGQYRLYDRTFRSSVFDDLVAFPRCFLDLFEEIFGNSTSKGSQLKSCVWFEMLTLLGLTFKETREFLSLVYDLPLKWQWFQSKLGEFERNSLLVNYLLENGFVTSFMSLMHPFIQNFARQREILDPIQEKITKTCGNVSFANGLCFSRVLAPEPKISFSDPTLIPSWTRRDHLTIPDKLGQSFFQSFSTQIDLPKLASILADSGKIQALDELLVQLKSEGHRCLIYSQMTRMLDILVDYLILRKFPFVRLDGSSSTEERRDVVRQFQTDSSIFCFLLSTRAGGIGINLTAADTVIFYDSDWNPTNDLQAMDRAHRLGQTKQVTVYRLITKNTIEERILSRAQVKDRMRAFVLEADKMSGQTARELLMDTSEDLELDVGKRRSEDDVVEEKRLNVG